jgi:shikimate dehydrogenase
VIGAGGASRAVLKALIDAGYEAIALANRTHARALELARHFGAPVTGCDLQDLPTLIEGADIIVNATSAGLHDTGDLSVPWKRAKQGAIATDLIYVPLITPFLEEAKREGLHVVDGLGMLLHQAVPGFERWFGIRPTVDADLRAHILADLRR